MANKENGATTTSMELLIKNYETIAKQTQPIIYSPVYKSAVALNNSAAAQLAHALQPQTELWNAVNKASLLAQSLVNQNTLNGLEEIARLTNSFMNKVVLPTVSYSQFVPWIVQIYDSPQIKQLAEMLSGMCLASDDIKGFMEKYAYKMYEVKWCPNAGQNQSLQFMKETYYKILAIFDESENADDCEKQIDAIIFDCYSRDEIEEIKNGWKNHLPEHIYRITHEAVQAYHREEYALTIAGLATLWERIICEKAERPYEEASRSREHLKKLLDDSTCGKAICEYYDVYIVYRYKKYEEIKANVPGRNPVAHGGYTEYPSKKAALNAILFTDIVTTHI